MATAKQAPTPAAPPPAPSVAVPAASMPRGGQPAPPPPEPKTNPAREAAERERKARENALQGAAVAEVESAEVATDKASPKGAKAAPPTSASTEASDDSAPGSADPGAAERPRPQPRYDSESFKAWARNNPEAAANVLGLAKADANAFVKLQNKERKRHEEEARTKKEIAESRSLLQSEAKKILDEVQPVMDLTDAMRACVGDVKAGKSGDFDAGDQLFEQVFGLPFDDYARARARRGLSVTPEARALRLENERLRKQLETKEAKAEFDMVFENVPKPPKAPPKDTAWIASELGDDHPVREVGGWQEKIQAILDENVDEHGDYTVTAEDAADQVLEGVRAKLLGNQAPAAKPTVARAPRRTTVTNPPPAPEPAEEQPPKNFAERVVWATQRAMRGVT
jgi:hypothetical protein